MPDSFQNRYLRTGFTANTSVSGRIVTTDTGETFTAIVADQPLLADPADLAKQKLPVYCTIASRAGDVSNPRAVAWFSESDGKRHRVIRYEETSGDAYSWKWFCESVRQ